MSVTFKQLLETSYIQVNSKIEELNRLFGITRTFSIKTNGHIKIITNLVNELTDSDDILTLVDTELIANNYNNKFSHTTNIQKYSGKSTSDIANQSPLHHTVNVNINDKKSGLNFEDHARSVNHPQDRNPTVSTHEQSRYNQNVESHHSFPKLNEENALTKILESYKNENKKLWESLKKGQTDTDFIKGIFEKLLDTFTKQKQPDVQVFPARDSIQHENCANCLKNPSLKSPLIPQHGSQSCYIPQNPINKKVDCLHNADFHETESLRSLKDNLDKSENDRAEKNKSRNESGINEMFKQYVELKKQFEKMNEDKNRQISDLTMLLNQTRDRSAYLLQEVELLAQQKSVLENTIGDVIGQNRVNSERMALTFEQSTKNFERELQRLKDHIDNLTRENEDLRQQAKNHQKFKNEEDYYKVKLTKLENDYNDLQNANEEMGNRNAELISLLDKSNEMRNKTKIVTETTTLEYNDDLLKCLYSQADYIESGMSSVFHNSIFKN